MYTKKTKYGVDLWVDTEGDGKEEDFLYCGLYDTEDEAEHWYTANYGDI